MNLDSLTLRLRPRIASEAMDLGQLLLRRNAAAVYMVWVLTVLPIMLACMLLLPVAPWLPPWLIWWLKPLYGRVVLFVLSRAVFGEHVGVRDLSWRSIFGSSLWWSLTLGRFDMARSFSLPVYLLEGLNFKRRRARFKVLQKSTRGNAVLLTTAFVHAELFVNISLVLVGLMLLPREMDLPFWSWLTDPEAPMGFKVFTSLSYIAAISLMEPLYVASGFTLYLNRRVELEAWDIEVDLKRHLADVEPDDDLGPPQRRQADAAPGSALEKAA